MDEYIFLLSYVKFVSLLTYLIWTDSPQRGRAGKDKVPIVNITQAHEFVKIIFSTVRFGQVKSKVLLKHNSSFQVFHPFYDVASSVNNLDPRINLTLCYFDDAVKAERSKYWWYLLCIRTMREYIKSTKFKSKRD